MKKNYVSPSVKNVNLDNVAMMAVSIEMSGSGDGEGSHEGDVNTEVISDDTWQYEW
ncbi:MAG: hypothetical protein MJZ60_09780 [Bacteroidaceae bacterium]|nr:hypothetical protein [Bacteroidaceae bacterium]